MFDWDPVKARRNQQKHGVTFEEASSIFYDPLSVTGLDPDHSTSEQRYVTIGMSDKGRLLVVAHKEEDDSIRIISARVTDKRGRKTYEEG